MVSDYAAAIGVAWKFLDSSNKKMYSTNLLPDAIREGQRVFKLSWHGYVLLGLIFGATLLSTTQIQRKQQQIVEKQSLLDVKNSQIAENTTLQNSIQTLQQQLASYNASMALYDSLVPGADKFSKAFERLSNGVDDLNSIWVTEFAAGETGQVTLSGFSVARSRIPRMSALFDKAELKEVTTEEIRDETVYRYKIEVPSIEPKR
jgi:Tfp pilus assembly protein PilN